MNRKSRRSARHNRPSSPLATAAPVEPQAAPGAEADLAAKAVTFDFPTPPTPVSERLMSLDLLRGFAVMGILLMNIVSFAMPLAAYINPRAWGPQTSPDTLAWALSFILVDGKMRGLFSLLFGASMLLMMEKAAMDGRDPMRTHLYRIAWLMVFGIAHYVFLWEGDILMTYACVGAVAALFVRREALDLAKLAFLSFGVHIVVMLTILVPAWKLAAAAAAPHATPAILSAWEDLQPNLGSPSAAYLASETNLYLGPWHGIVTNHLGQLVGQIYSDLTWYGFDTVGFMLLGMAMMKAGFLTNGWKADRYRATARHCLIVGLPPMILLAALCWWRNFSTLTTFGSFLLWSFPFRIPLTVAYAALVLLWLSARRQSPVTMRVAAVGRMAFSNYLGTSILMTAIFYGWGLGLFGTVPRVALYAFVLGAWCLMLLWSKPWLDRFTYGPFEWAWQSLARGKVQKLRR